MESAATGTIFKEFSGKNMGNFKLIVPTPEVFVNFEKRINPLYEFQKILGHEFRILETLRDTLFLKVPAGENKSFQYPA